MSEMGYIEYVKRRIRDFIQRRIHEYRHWNNTKELKKEDKAREFREDFAYEKGLRCGNCVNYFCDEYDGDHCENDNDMMAIKCREFVSWRDVLRLNFAFFKKIRKEVYYAGEKKR